MGRSLTLPATLHWPTVRRIYAPRGGIITALRSGSGPLSQDDQVMRLDERPMTVIAADVPAFRTLRTGDAGRDVAALNAFLRHRGYSVDAASDVFSAATKEAVAAWQGSLLLPSDGVVQLGDVLFLPSRSLDGPSFAWGTDATVGAPIAPGVELLDELAAVPQLTVQFGSAAPDGLAAGTSGAAQLPDGTSIPVTLESIAFSEGLAVGNVAGSSGALCSVNRCPTPDAGGHDMRVSIEFTLVEQTTGPLVPSAAVQTDPAIGAYVLLAGGQRQPVKILVADQGQAIVSGIETGTLLVIP